MGFCRLAVLATLCASARLASANCGPEDVKFSDGNTVAVIDAECDGRLDVSNQGWTLAEAKAVARAIMDDPSPRIGMVNFSGNPIGDAGVEVLADVGLTFENLTHLHLRALLSLAPHPGRTCTGLAQLSSRSVLSVTAGVAHVFGAPLRPTPPHPP